MTNLNNLNKKQSFCLKQYADMSPGCQQVAQKFEQNECALAKADILLQFDLGVQLIAITRDSGKYGKDAVRQLAERTGRSERDLIAMQVVAENFTRAEVEDAARRRTSIGRHITFRHLVLAASQRTGIARSETLEKIFEEPMSEREVERRLKAVGLGMPQRRARGTGASTPSSDGPPEAQAAAAPGGGEENVEFFEEAASDGGTEPDSDGDEEQYDDFDLPGFGPEDVEEGTDWIPE